MLNPETTALVLIDLQKGYCKPGFDCASAPLNWDVSAADELCRLTDIFVNEARGILPAKNIIWTRMEEKRETYAKNSPHVQDDFFVTLCDRDTESHDYHIVQPANGEIEIFKTHPSAFSIYSNIVKPSGLEGHSLEEYLNHRGIRDVAFAGVIESRCVQATINGASERGYRSWALRDLIGHPTRHSKSPRAVLFDTEAAAVRQISDGFLSYGSSSQEFLHRLKNPKLL